MTSHPPDHQASRAKTSFLDTDESDATGDFLSAMPDTKPQPVGPEANPSHLDIDAFRRPSQSPLSFHGRLSPAHARALSPASRQEKEDDDAKSELSLLEYEAAGQYTSGPYLDDRLNPAGLYAFASGPSRKTWKSWLFGPTGRWWARHRCVLFVFFAQLFGSVMNLSARLLELDEKPMHPFQILFLRMSVTIIISIAYMRWRKVPDAPFGPKGIRVLLIVRGVSGFFGLSGMWFSMMYLPLADATVMTFLIPSVAGYMCHVLMHDPFTRKEQIGSYIALAGVVLIARPTSLFSFGSSPASDANLGVPMEVPRNVTESISHSHLEDEITASQRLFAVGIALVGVLGGSGAITSIRWIGKRAHPLISVTYFGTFVTFISTAALSLGPSMGYEDVHFALPHNLRQWGLLLAVAVCGFSTQYLSTAGLGGEKSNRATAMVYTNMLFAAAFDRWVFGHEMGPMSLMGCGMIIGSALWVAISKKEPRPDTDGLDVEAVAQVPEAIPMLLTGEGESDDRNEDEIPLERIR